MNLFEMIWLTRKDKWEGEKTKAIKLKNWYLIAKFAFIASFYLSNFRPHFSACENGDVHVSWSSKRHRIEVNQVDGVFCIDFFFHDAVTSLEALSFKKALIYIKGYILCFNL